MATRCSVQEDLDLIFQEEEADRDLVEDVSEQQDNMEENSHYSTSDEDLYIEKQDYHFHITLQAGWQRCPSSDLALTVVMVIHVI